MKATPYTSWLAISAALICLTQVGCVTKAVSVKSCVPADYPEPPAYTDTRDALQTAPDFASRYQLLAGNWFARDDRLSKDEALIASCR